MNWTEFPDRSALVAGVARCVQEQLEDCLAARPEACIALAGGGTPMPIYASLAATAVDWSRVTAVATDERWVPAQHSAHNGRQISRQFAGAGLRVANLVPEDAQGQANPRQAEQTLAGMPGPFDLVLVGMGDDAHFASLFPHSVALRVGLDPTAAVDVLVVMPDPLPPEAPFARISLSLSKLLDTRRLLLVITGQAKRAVLKQAARAQADEQALPIAALLRAAGEKLEIFWSP